MKKKSDSNSIKDYCASVRKKFGHSPFNEGVIVYRERNMIECFAAIGIYNGQKLVEFRSSELKWNIIRREALNDDNYLQFIDSINNLNLASCSNFFAEEILDGETYIIFFIGDSFNKELVLINPLEGGEHMRKVKKTLDDIINRIRKTSKK